MNQLKFEQAEFAVLKAQDLDEQDHVALAIDQYQQAVELCLRVVSYSSSTHSLLSLIQQETCSDENFRKKLKAVASQALLRAEHLKEKQSRLAFDELTASLPDVPSAGLSLFPVGPLP